MGVGGTRLQWNWNCINCSFWTIFKYSPKRITLSLSNLDVICPLPKLLWIWSQVFLNLAHFHFWSSVLELVAEQPPLMHHFTFIYFHVVQGTYQAYSNNVASGKQTNKISQQSRTYTSMLQLQFLPQAQKICSLRLCQWICHMTKYKNDLAASDQL